MKILLAVDGSPFSEEAVKEVARRPWPPGSEIKVVSVVGPVNALTAEPWRLPENYFEELERAATEKAQESAAAALSALRHALDDSLKLSAETPCGLPMQVIVETAAHWGADLIVLGSHGYGFWNRLTLGSVSQSVAAHAGCSVEIVKRRQPKSEKK